MTRKTSTLDLVVGRRGSGKSRFVKEKIADQKRLVIFDPVGEYGRDGIVDFHTAKASELRAHLAAHWNDEFRAAFVPPPSWPMEALHSLGAFLLACQRPYSELADDGLPDDPSNPKPITLVVEEMNLGYPATALPRELYAMPTITLQGRHYGINVIGVTQRPALISKDFRANILRLVTFPLAEVDDADAVLKKIGREHADELRNLRDYHYLDFANGKVRAGP